MYYANRSGNGKDAYYLNPIWYRLLESRGNHGMDKNTIVFEDTDDGIKHCVKVPQDELHRRDTRYPNLDRLAEETLDSMWS